MGKKKSVALIVLATLVLAALLFISVTPSFYVSAAEKFNSLLSIVDLGTDLGGGYYTVYYPEGVISQGEYEMLVAEYEEGQAADTDVEDPAQNYLAYKGIYLSKDICEDDGNGNPTGEEFEAFRAEFRRAFNAISARFESKGFIGCSVKVQDDYTIRVDIPYTDESVSKLFDSFAYSGTLLFTDDGADPNEMRGDAAHVKGAEVVEGTNGFAVAINLTSLGRSEFRTITAAISGGSDSSSSSSSSGGTLYIKVGDEVLTQASVSSELDQDVVYISGAFDSRDAAQTIASVINSTLDENKVFDMKLDASQIFTFEPTMGEHASVIIAAAFGVFILAMIVLMLVRYKGMGLAHVYGFLLYALLLIVCIALIPAMRVDIVGVIAIALSAALMVFFNVYAFNNIREEFATGKTLTASVKAGYKKSLAFTIDAHLVLALLGLVLYLISTATVRYAALIFLIGTVLSAACTLAVTRFFLYMFLAQPKNKIAFCNLRREETEDE